MNLHQKYQKLVGKKINMYELGTWAIHKKKQYNNLSATDLRDYLKWSKNRKITVSKKFKPLVF